jgi:phosphoglycerate dehydrogenase-like enzyme
MTIAREIVFFCSPLETEQVDRIRAAAGGRVELVHLPELHPPLRYVADHNGRADFRRAAAQEARWRAELLRATILWDFPAAATGSVAGIAQAPQVRWVQTTSAGVGQMVARLGLADSDLVVTTARGVHAQALTEFVFLALLMRSKDLARLQRDQRDHRWERHCGGELAGGTIAIIGAGSIGAQVARVARAFGMRAIGTLANPSPARAAALGLDAVHGQDRLHEVLAAADAVVLCTPHTAATERMIDAAALAAMKPGATLINIARGLVVDEAAMIDALRRRHLGFAALDVATVEPLATDSPLWDMDNVLISPHSASTAPSENRKITDIFLHNLGCWLDGRRDAMRNVLDKKRLY